MYLTVKTGIIFTVLFMLNFGVSSRRFSDGVAEKDLKEAMAKFNTSFPAEFKLVAKRMQTMLKEIEAYRKHIGDRELEDCKKFGVPEIIFKITKDKLIDERCFNIKAF